MREDGDPVDSLKPQPGQWDSYHPKFHPLPGKWAQDQLNGRSTQRSSMMNGSHTQTEVQRAIAAERQVHEYWERWQGVIPGKPVYENPREAQNTLLPTEKFANG